MLNRHTLRIKVMQALYAFQQARVSDYHASIERIDAHFEPDPLAADPPDRAVIHRKRTFSAEVFETTYQERRLAAPSPDREGEITPDVRDAVMSAVNFYHEQVKRDRTFLRNQLLADAQHVYEGYLRVLQLLLELADLVGQEQQAFERRRLKGTPPTPGQLRLHRNPLLETLRSNEEIRAAMIRHNISWANDRSFVKALYRDVLATNEKYLQYQAAETVSAEEHEAMVRHIVKTVIFKSDMAQAFFEEWDINWAENSETTRSMVLRTLKSLAAPAEEGVSALAPLSSNWEDDRSFFVALYDTTLDHREALEALVAGRVENWDMERVAALDKIILQMALAEMIHFPSIPVKVTINEYIEISKKYSTPKSKQFVNGLLDVLAAELTANGTIRKSGRGLLDNR
ncbi:N utilization substance protein B [Catalinimonas alkaloidigena]|uniref:Transcription antitermination protein NusB n=1 Tax=Catalinimonas alkaloidigena TaxID=1075417 RepID=A0A1G9DE13_9BACT|nr:transcription antitermination factor NusB [Catalinimonas alkaloidigena]SDK62115.1 N utilization substance protein B [Catalinimonas alkaloidigena]